MMQTAYAESRAAASGPRKLLLGASYFPPHAANRMAEEGDVAGARERFLRHRFNNLDFLLRRRYGWMNAFLDPGQTVVEIGAGAGFSEFYLSVRPMLTDTTKQPWIDRVLDATRMNLADASVDRIVAAHNIHHFGSPARFFDECQRVLKPGGLILIQEINTSLLMRVLLRLMRHEGWSYDVDVFDRDAVANDPRDPWSANCAIPELLFDRPGAFEAAFAGLDIVRNNKTECLTFPLSGGVIAKTRLPELPTWLLNMIARIDDALIAFLPGVFAVGRSVVVRKRP